MLRRCLHVLHAHHGLRLLCVCVRVRVPLCVRVCVRVCMRRRLITCGLMRRDLSVVVVEMVRLGLRMSVVGVGVHVLLMMWLLLVPRVRVVGRRVRGPGLHATPVVPVRVVRLWQEGCQERYV